MSFSKMSYFCLDVYFFLYQARSPLQVSEFTSKHS